MGDLPFYQGYLDIWSDSQPSKFSYPVFKQTVFGASLIQQHQDMHCKKKIIKKITKICTVKKIIIIKINK